MRSLGPGDLKRVVLLLSILIVPFSLARAADEPDVRSADYVIGMLDAGMDQDDIIERIINDDLMFHFEKGDIDRLREAGAGLDLIRVVTRREVVEGEDYGSVTPYGGGYPYYYPGYALSPWYYGSFSYYYPRYGYQVYPYGSYPRHDRHSTITPRGGTRPRVAPRGSSHSSPPASRGQTRRPPRGSH
ncbi:MAG: hypothetical protein ACRDH5_15710 [bacterium]